jgi:hypothetical protein
MHSIRDILYKQRTGFFSGRGTTLSDAVMLLAFGPSVDPVALDLYYDVNSTKKWVKLLRYFVRHYRWLYADKIKNRDSVMMIKHTVLNETFELPLEAYFEIRLEVSLVYKDLIECPWANMNGGHNRIPS